MLAINVGVCTGCRICELVCSFHHKEVFSPELSSIKISKNNRSAEIELSVDSTCDLCLLCAESCCFGALRGVK